MNKLENHPPNLLFTKPRFVSPIVITAIAFILALFPLIEPDLISAPWYQNNRIQLALVLGTAGIWLPLVKWALQNATIAVKRIFYYREAHSYRKKFLQLSSLYSQMLAYLGPSQLDISKATKRNNLFFITIFKSTDNPLSKGDILHDCFHLRWGLISKSNLSLNVQTPGEGGTQRLQKQLYRSGPDFRIACTTRGELI